MFPAYYIFNTLLLILQFLNVVWTIQLLRVKSFVSKQTYIILMLCVSLVMLVLEVQNTLYSKLTVY